MRFSAFKIFSNSVCKRIITKGLGFRALLLYTISKVKLREDILVSQSIVPVDYQLKHAKGGRKPKLSLEDLLMPTLQ
ncbi:degenerate transposase (Orf1) [Streptococcus pneumoniae]|nr:degenerate transposase (Orf1) [Streptococcus pneumoniae]